MPENPLSFLRLTLCHKGYLISIVSLPRPLSLPIPCLDSYQDSYPP